MKKEILFSMDSLYRGTFKIHGYRFGEGEKALAIVGAMRGDEIQQQYICSQIINKLLKLEGEGQLVKGYEILVIPSVNPFSMNLEKRFWAMDNTDINRMFPGYDHGETTQRIASALFGVVNQYKYGIQMASFYMAGDFIPHVRMIQTGYEDVETASLFGLPYICLRKPLPFDTTLLNYNWQIWGTKAFSIYGGENSTINDNVCYNIIASLLRFMQKLDLIRFSLNKIHPYFKSVVMDESELITVKANTGGIFYKYKSAHSEVSKGELIATIIDPYEGHVIEKIKSPVDGIIFFAHHKPLVLEYTPIFKIQHG